MGERRIWRTTAAHHALRLAVVMGLTVSCGDTDDTATDASSGLTVSAPEAASTSSPPTSATTSTTTIEATTTPASTVAPTSSDPTLGSSPSSASEPASAVPNEVAFREGVSPCPAEELPAAAAFDASSGDLRWTTCSSEERYRDVVGVDDSVVLVGITGSDGQEVQALDVTDGRELWRRAISPPPSPDLGWPKGRMVGGGIVVLADVQSYGDLVGLDAVSGVERWRTRGAYPIAHTESMVVTMNSTGSLVGHDRQSGDQVWTAPALGGGDESGDVSGWTAVAVLDDRLVLPVGAKTVALDTASGVELWQGPRLDDPWAADGFVVGGMPEGGGVTEVAAVDAATGGAAWTAPGRESYPDRLTVGDGAAIVLDPDNGELVSYELPTGAIRWKQPFQAYVGQPQEVVGGSVITLWEEVLAAVATADGAVRWAWRNPVGSPWMNHLEANSTTVFVAINSLPFGD